MRSKRREWPFLASGWILEFFWCFSDEIDTYVPRNDFLKKQRANYETAAVQIWPASNWIDENLSFSPEVDKNFWHPTILSIVH